MAGTISVKLWLAETLNITGLVKLAHMPTAFNASTASVKLTKLFPVLDPRLLIVKVPPAAVILPTGTACDVREILSIPPGGSPPPELSFFHVNINRMVWADVQLPMSEYGILNVAVCVVVCNHNICR